MSRRADLALRGLFLAELVGLGLPSLLAMVFLAWMLLIGCISGVLVCLGKLFGTRPELSGSDALFVALLTAFGLLLCLGGFYAMWRFLRAALAYLRRGASGLTLADYRALPWAVPPLLLCFTMAVPGLANIGGEGWLTGFYVSGLGLMVPVLHLWLAWRGMRRAG
ncbi:hypothetical protein IAI18_03335 [Acetobacteraceae bacterium H6797]|nr:hypothetical protein [Acetobacteraceae bacterium H6797]